MREIAFFDFDGTLTKHDTLFEFAKFSVGKTALYRALIMSIPSILLWKFGYIDNSKAKETLFGHLYKGMDYAEFRKYGEDFAKVIDSDLRSDVMDYLHRHQEQGREVVIVSASIADWIKPWAAENGVLKVISTEAEVDSSGRLTGRFLTPNCHGYEKVKRIGQEFPHIEDSRTWGYGDSSGDDYLLDFVNYPYKV